MERLRKSGVLASLQERPADMANMGILSEPASLERRSGARARTGGAADAEPPTKFVPLQEPRRHDRWPRRGAGALNGSSGQACLG